MIDLKEKTDDIKELEIPEIKNENNEENIDNHCVPGSWRGSLPGRGAVHHYV